VGPRGRAAARAREVGEGRRPIARARKPKKTPTRSGAGLLELTTAKTEFEAEWVVGALKARGLRAVAFGEMLADEFAMSQKLVGFSGGVRVMVAARDLDRARDALASIERRRTASKRRSSAASTRRRGRDARRPVD